MSYVENLLDDPAVVSLQRLLVGFVDVDPDQVGVVLVSFSVSQALQQDLDKTETPAEEEGEDQVLRNSA